MNTTILFSKYIIYFKNGHGVGYVNPVESIQANWVLIEGN
jgi:hypothetical protein